MDLSGANVQWLTTDSKEDLIPTWSTNGTQIGFMSTRSRNGDIYTMNANNLSQTRLTSSSGIDTEPAWFGSTIAFSTDRHGSSNFELYTMPSAGGAKTRRTNVAGHDITPAWSVDGERLVFATNRSPGGGGNFNLMTIAKDGSNQQPLVVHAAADVFPDW